MTATSPVCQLPGCHLPARPGRWPSRPGKYCSTLHAERDLHSRKIREAELTVPSHQCEYAGCSASTRIAGIGANKYGRRNRFCRQHVVLGRDPGMVATRAAEHVALAKRPGYGVSTKAQHREMQRRGSVTRKGKPVSAAGRRVLERMWATTRAKPTKPSADYMRLIRAPLPTTAAELLVLEYRHPAPDARRLIRKHLRGLSRRHPSYTLKQVHDYIAAGLSRSAIQRKLGLKERQARVVIALVRSLDATPAAP